VINNTNIEPPISPVP